MVGGQLIPHQNEDNLILATKMMKWGALQEGHGETGGELRLQGSCSSEDKIAQDMM